MFDINEFRSQTNKGGFAKPSNFYCLFSRPNTSTATQSRDLIARTFQTSIPGRQPLITDMVTYGAAMPMAFGSSFTEASVSVYCSHDYSEKEYFELWVDEMLGSYRTRNSNAATMYDIGYYDDYKGSMQVYTMDDTGKQTFKVEYIGVIPSNISNVQLDWSSGTEITKLEISFKYQYYKNIK